MADPSVKERERIGGQGELAVVHPIHDPHGAQPTAAHAPDAGQRGIAQHHAVAVAADPCRERIGRVVRRRTGRRLDHSRRDGARAEQSSCEEKVSAGE